MEQKDLDDAIAQLREFTVVEEWRRTLLATAYYLMRTHALWTAIPNCDSLEDLCLRLGVSQRTLQRYAHEGWLHECHPSVRREVEAVD